MDNMYCYNCGNTLFDFDGNPCSCTIKSDRKYRFGTSLCDFVPLSYRGIKFDKNLVNADMPDAYREFLQRLRLDIISMKFRYKNILICSPIGTSKTIWVYDICEELMARNITVAPYYDLLEIRVKLLEYKESEIYDSDVLFAKIPLVIDKYTFNILSTLLDRRVRKSKTTIITYQGIYQSLSGVDEYKILSSMRGDGSLSSLRIEQFNFKT